VSRHIFIDGVDRIGDYIGGSLDIQAALSYAIDTCGFTVRGSEPTWGQEVTVEDDSLGRLFAGIVVKPTMKWDSTHGNATWEVDCDDFTTLLNSRIVTERYQNVTATEAFLDLVGRYAPAGFTVAGVGVCETVIEFLDLIDIPLAEALTAVCEYTGWQWFPDYFKDIHFFDLASGPPAPMILKPGGDFKDFSRTIDSQVIKNRILVRGGKGKSQAPIIVTLYGDGSRREWPLPAIPRELASMTVGGVVKAVGWDGIDAQAGYLYVVNANNLVLACTESEPTPADGVVIVISYYPEVPIVARVDDLESQALMAQVLGGDGVWEAVLVDPSITDLSQALAAGRAELRLWANPKVSIDFQTHSTGWIPGQTVTAELEDRGVEGAFVVQEVKVATFTADHWITKVKAGSTLYGLADFIKSLSMRSTQRSQGEAKGNVDKQMAVADVLTVADLVTVDASSVIVDEVGTGAVGISELTG